VGGRYSAGDLETMVEPEMVLTPTNGLTRDVRITVTAPNADDCYDIAAELGKQLAEDDAPAYDQTYALYDGYLSDLKVVVESIEKQARAGGEGFEEAAAPGVLAVPPDGRTVYSGGTQVYRLFSQNRGYTENPYLLSSLALVEQVYVDAYLKTRSPVYSQPTKVVLPPAKPGKPADAGTAKIILACVFIALTLGVFLALINYRLQQAKARAS
jgi:hypothetical protein